MNSISLEKRKFNYTVKEVEYTRQQTEFIIDGIALSEALLFSDQRPWFGETFIDDSSESFMPIALSAFLGETKLKNQFGTERFGLYSCHCGCDYCGLVSCEIERVGKSIYWKNICYEDEVDDPDPDVKRYDFEFNFEEYKRCIHEILRDT